MRSIHRLACAAALAVLAVACGSSTSNPDGGSNNTVKVDRAMSPTAISSAFSTAAADSTIEMAAGTYHLTNSLNLASKNNITVKGAGAAQTILDFNGRTPRRTAWSKKHPLRQTVEGHLPGLLGPEHRGYGLRFTGGTGVHVNRANVLVAHPGDARRLRRLPGPEQAGADRRTAPSTAPATPASTSAVDGIRGPDEHPDQQRRGHRDRNSFNSDVTGNNSHDNTAGFLVFDLPGLPQVGGHSHHRVYGNTFTNNTTPTSATQPGTVALIPAGTGGVAVMANTKVEIFNNTFSGTMPWVSESSAASSPSKQPAELHPVHPWRRGGTERGQRP